MTLLGFDAATLALIATACTLSFVVRGLSGFGASMIGIGSLSLVLPPVQVVPAFLALEILTTAHLLPGVWRQVDWRSLRWVIAGCLLATPFGLQLLAGLDVDAMRLLVSGCLLGIASFMLFGPTGQLAARPKPGPLGAIAVGAASGLLNGAAGIGGPPAIVRSQAAPAGLDPAGVAGRPGCGPHRLAALGLMFTCPAGSQVGR